MGTKGGRAGHIFGNCLAVFLDFSFGTFVVIIVGGLLNYSITAIHIIMGGVAATMPDFDVVIPLLQKKDPGMHHWEGLTHRPLLALPVALVVGYWLGGIFWAVTAVSILLCHYIHDTGGFGGGGLAWLWPFSKKYISLSGFTEQSKSLERQWAGKHYEWLEATWLRPSAAALMEMSIGTILFGIAGSTVLGWRITFGLLAALWITVLYVWRTRASP